MKKHFNVLGLVFLLALAGCLPTDDDEKDRTLIIAANKVECSAFATRVACYLARFADEDKALSNFPFGIDGFGDKYKWGFKYRLLVRETRVTNPPEDAPDRFYTLVDIISKTPVDVGTTFSVEIFSEDSIQFNATPFVLFPPEGSRGKAFTCAPADCAMLRSLLVDQQLAVLLQFTHGSPNAPLVLTAIRCAASPETFAMAC